MATSMMKKTMDKLDIPPVPEYIEMIADAGCKLYACKATVDMFKLKKEDFCRPGRLDHQRRQVLRDRGRRRDHLHLIGVGPRLLVQNLIG